MTLAEAGEVFDYWAENPPTYLIVQAVARMLGWTPAPPQTTLQSLDDIAAAPPPGLAVTRGVDPGMPPPLFDPETLRERNRALAQTLSRTAGEGGEPRMRRAG